MDDTMHEQTKLWAFVMEWKAWWIVPVAVVLVLAALEGCLALLGVSWSRLYDGDPGYYWTLKAGLDLEAVPHDEEGTTFPVVTSAEGLRDGPIPARGPWVLALGCSTTFGWGVAAEEAWPQRLEERLGVEVINAGVPGHTTHQGLTYAPPLLARGPDLVILSWLVRDAQLGQREDRAARPTPFPHNLRLTQALRKLRKRRAPAAGTVPRVSAEDYLGNLQSLSALATESGARVMVLAFPMVTPPEHHVNVLQQLPDPPVAPVLERGDYFAHDDVHLTASGNDKLAGLLAGPVAGIMESTRTAPPDPRSPGQTP